MKKGWQDEGEEEWAHGTRLEAESMRIELLSKEPFLYSVFHQVAS
jgi:hypothetical protein